MSRSAWKPPFCHPSVLRKWRKSSEKGGAQTRGMKIKIHSRSSVILPQFLGYSFSIYNGKDYIPVNISNENMIGHKFGEFSPTRKFTGHSGDKKATRR
jgi:small subunit ribosomal protein S19